MLKTSKAKKNYNFLQKNWLNFILLLMIFILFRQIFIKNQLPQNIVKKIDEVQLNITKIKTLKTQNQALSKQLNALSDPKMELLESRARYNFGLIKKGEKFYKITPQNNNQK